MKKIFLLGLSAFALYYQLPATNVSIVNMDSMLGKYAQLFNERFAFVAIILSAVIVFFNNFVRNKEELKKKSITDEAGEKGEILLTNKLNSMRKYLKNSWMPSDNGFESIVLISSNSAISQEIDQLIVTGSNLYLIEVKHWKGKVKLIGGQLYQDNKARGSVNGQSTNKVKYLNDLLNKDQRELDHLGEYNIVPIYVFTHQNVQLDKGVGENYIYLKELEKFIKRHESSVTLTQEQRQLKINYAQEKIMSILDNEPGQKERHLERINEVGNNVNFKKNSFIENIRAGVDAVKDSVYVGAAVIYFMVSCVV